MHALGSCLFNNVSFLSLLTLTRSVINFADLPAILVSELGYIYI